MLNNLSLGEPLLEISLFCPKDYEDVQAPPKRHMARKGKKV
jgi:hypothetical protein